MFTTIKKIISTLAKNAVIITEEEYGSGQGEIKKQKAINYIIDNLPFPALINKIIAVSLSNMIDELIESSVDKLHELQHIQGE